MDSIIHVIIQLNLTPASLPGSCSLVAIIGTADVGRSLEGRAPSRGDFKGEACRCSCMCEGDDVI